jgi:putative cell wall-binding protein
VSRRIRVLMIAMIVTALTAPLSPAVAAEPAATASIRGKLSTAEGVPVRTLALVDAAGSVAAWPRERGPDGSFLFADVAPGSYTLRATGTPGIIHLDDRYPDQFLGGFSLDDADFFAVGEGADVSQDFVLTEGVRLSGSLSGSDGGAIDRASMTTVSGSGETFSGAIRFVQDGSSFRTNWFAPGEYVFTFTAGDPYLRETRRISLGSATDERVDLVFALSASLGGSLEVRYDGALYGPVWVEIALFAPDDLETPAWTGWARNGDYGLWQVPPGRYLARFAGGVNDYLVEQWWPGVDRPEHAEPITVTTGEETTLDADVVYGARVIVDTLYHSGMSYSEPIGGTTVRLFRKELDGSIVEIPQSPFVTGDDGTFVIPGGTQPGWYASWIDNPRTRGVFQSQFSCARTLEDACFFEISAGDIKRLGLRFELARFDSDRIGGRDRYETAAAISREVFDDASAPLIYLASGENFPDALGAGAAAIAGDATILTTRQGALPDATAAELARLQPSEVRVLGDEQSVSAAVLADVESLTGANVTRIGGIDRYATSRAVARAAFAEAGADTVFIVTGRKFPDALSAAPAAGRAGAPMILVDGTAPTLDDATRTLISELGAIKAIIVGSDASVSSGVERALGSVLGAAAVQRLAGDSRYATAATVNEAFFSDAEETVLANGEGFADATVAAPLAAALNAPVQLATQHCIPGVSMTGIVASGSGHLLLLGGEPTLAIGVEYSPACDGPYNGHWMSSNTLILP